MWGRFSLVLRLAAAIPLLMRVLRILGSAHDGLYARSIAIASGSLLLAGFGRPLQSLQASSRFGLSSVEVHTQMAPFARGARVSLVMLDQAQVCRPPGYFGRKRIDIRSR